MKVTVTTLMLQMPRLDAEALARFLARLSPDDVLSKIGINEDPDPIVGGLMALRIGLAEVGFLGE